TGGERAAPARRRLARGHGLCRRKDAGGVPHEGGVCTHLRRKLAREPCAWCDDHARKPELSGRRMSGSLALVYPVLAQVLLTFAVYILLGVRRYQALTSRRTRLREVALSSGCWPCDAKKVENNIRTKDVVPVLLDEPCSDPT